MRLHKEGAASINAFSVGLCSSYDEDLDEEEEDKGDSEDN